MSSEAPPGAEAPKGLPPVAPPSASFIVQLFLVPGIIVAVVVGLYLTAHWLFGGAHAPAQLLSKLDDSNPEVRWRGAEQLAQVLLRDQRLAADPRFALDLADRLRQTLATAEPAEQALAERLTREPALIERFSKMVQGEPDYAEATPEWKTFLTQWKALEPQFNYILYLTACLGNLSLPAGAPLLSEMAAKEPAHVDLLAALQRRRAVWALANLGEGVKRFDQLPSDQREAIRTIVDEEAAGVGERGQLAKKVQEFLQGRSQGKPTTLGVDAALVQCAGDRSDPFLRQLAAYAMGFWEGSPEENARMDEALARLTNDGGTGDEALAKLFDVVPQEARSFTRSPGSRIRYEATLSLARRGSTRVPLSMLKEMLDEAKQRENFQLQRKDGRDTPDQATATLMLTAALKAITQLHTRQPALDLAELGAPIDKLARSDDPLVRREAEATQRALGPTK